MGRSGEKSATRHRRHAADSTEGGGGGGRGGRARGTALRRGARTTAESTGEVADEQTTIGTPGPGAKRRGKGPKEDAPGARKVLARRAAKGKKKSSNRPGASGTGSKKQARGSSGRRRSGSRSGGGKTNKKK
jgi:hypothetical protein